jgi:hypothetical protein
MPMRQGCSSEDGAGVVVPRSIIRAVACSVSGPVSPLGEQCAYRFTQAEGPHAADVIKRIGLHL